MASQAADACADKSHSEDETLGFILEQRPATGVLRGRVRKVVLALGLVAGAVVAAATLRPTAGCEASGLSQSTDVGSALQLAERRQAADEKARAIVEVLNEKPQDEIKGLVTKAMHKAGENALAKQRRKMGSQKSFNQILADVSNQCTLQRPDAEDGDGVFLGHDYNSFVYMDAHESGPTQWKITHAGAPDVYNLEAIVPGAGGSFLAHELGHVKLGQAAESDLKWQIHPLGDGKKADGLYTVKAVGALEGDSYLSRKGKVGVHLTDELGGDGVWKIPCVANEYEREAQRKAICAFNVMYAVQYVARSSLLIQAAARTCPNSKGLLNKICAINSLVVVASFSNLALAISDSATSCSEATNVRALCASAVEALIVSLSTIGAGGLITATACKPGLQASDLGLPEGATPANLGGPAYLGRRLFLGGGKANFLGQCILDFTQVAWSLGSVGLAITAAARDSCPSSIQGTGILVGLSQSACSMDIAAVIYAFGRISLFLALATIHCTDELNLQALCAGGVSALVAAAAALVVTGDAFYIACDQGISVVNSGGTVPVRIGAAAEAGATRRLAAQSLAAGAKHADVEKMVKDLGYNISNPLKLPTFDNIDSAMKVLEEFDSRKAADFGVDDASLRKNFDGVEDMWKHMGFNASDLKAPPAAPPRKDESERFVKLMESVMTTEDKAKVEEAMGPQLAQKWRWLSSKKCA